MFTSDKDIEANLNQQRDSAAAAKIASLNQKESKTMTPISQEPEVPREVRFSIRGPRFTSYNLMRQRLAQQQNMHAAAAARYAAMEAGKKLLQEANEAYEQAYVENLRELEYGLSCFCNRYPWQHELHPSGTAKRDRERQQQREDEDMRNRDGARP